MGTGLLATELDLAQERANAGGETERLAFFRLFSDTPFFLLLEREAAGEVMDPRIFTLDEGPLVLAFDREERLALMGEGPQSHAEIPGRVLARLLADQGLGLGLNLGSDSASEMLLPATAMVWLRDVLDSRLEARLAPLTSLAPPMPELLAHVQAIMATAPVAWGGLAKAVWVCTAEGIDLLLVEGAAPESEPALARALAEALAFAGHGSGRGVEIAFAAPGSRGAIAVRTEWPARPDPGPEASVRAAPGMDGSRPPILR